MQRILIADASPSFADCISKQLEKDFSVQCCNDGRRVLEYINELDPEILLLDMMLPGMDGFSIIDSLLTAGKMTKIIPVLPIHDEMVAAMLAAYDIGFVFTKPCSPDFVASFLHQYAGKELFGDWSVDDYLDNILMRMGFSVWHTRYACLSNAILLRYRGEDSGVTKGVYPIVADICGGNDKSVEKSIRDMIRHAWLNGDRAIWSVYFPGGSMDKCPTNDMFIGRMALALRNRERARKPIEQKMQQKKIG